MRTRTALSLLALWLCLAGGIAAAGCSDESSEPVPTLVGTWANDSDVEDFTLDADGSAKGSVLLDRAEDFQGAADFFVDKYLLAGTDDQPTIALFDPVGDTIELHYKLEGDTLRLWNVENTVRTYMRRR